MKYVWIREHRDSFPLAILCQVLEVSASSYYAWLDPANDDREKLQALLDQFTADRMTARLVSTYVSNARHEGHECLNPPA